MDQEIIYSAQAQALLDEMPGFDRAAFEEWWWKQQRSVGSQNILQFLLYQRSVKGITLKK
jgi:hypothetical protein